MPVRWCSAVILWTLTFPLLAGEPKPMPEVYYAEEWSTDRPYFVAASRAVTEGGEVDTALIQAGSLKHHLTWPEENGCVQVLTDTIGIEPPDYRANFRKALDSADWVFLSKVTGLRSGFAGTGGTLIRVDVQKTIKGTASGHGEHYLFLPVGEFEVAGVHLCYTNQRYPALPSLGDRLLLFVDRNRTETNTWNHGEFLWTGNDTGVVVLDKSGHVGLPERLRDEGLPTDSQELIRKAVLLLAERMRQVEP